MTGNNRAVLMVMRILSAIILLAVGGIHLFLVFDGVGGLLGVLFVLNAIAALVLAIGMLVLHGRLLTVTTVLSLLFVIATLLALVLALTVGLFGITESWSFTLVPQTVVVESIGIVVLAIATLGRAPQPSGRHDRASSPRRPPGASITMRPPRLAERGCGAPATPRPDRRIRRAAPVRRPTSTPASSGTRPDAASVNAIPCTAVTTLRQYRGGSCRRSHGSIHPAATNA